MSTSTWLERGQAPPRQQSKRASSSRHAIRKKKEREQDEHKLEQRKKQIAYGEITRGYINFMKMSQRYAINRWAIPRDSLVFRHLFVFDSTWTCWLVRSLHIRSRSLNLFYKRTSIELSFHKHMSWR